MHFAKKLFLLFLICSFWFLGSVRAQVDTVVNKKQKNEKDTTEIIEKTISEFLDNDTTKNNTLKVRTARQAALRSAIIPGWGQAYNKDYWKIPIVYAALGVTGTIFVNNLRWYKRTRYAYIVAYNIQNKKDSIGSESYKKVYERLRTIFFEGQGGIRAEDIRSYRDSYRRYVDYSALYFVIGWGLNVVEATVAAHLNNFDISPNLSFHVQPGYSELAGTNGLSLVLRIK